MEKMYLLMNERYHRLIIRWLDHDVVAMIGGIFMAFNCLFFHIFVNFGPLEHENEPVRLITLVFNIGVYMGSSVLHLYKTEWAAAVCLVIIHLQSWRYTSAYLQQAFCAVIERTNWRPKVLVYPVMLGLLLVSWGWFNHSGLLLERSDYSFDSLIMLCVAFMWATHDSETRAMIVPNIVIIALCLKLTYINDKEQSHHPPSHGFN
mmetsp:Transcript_45136/g.59839  ORF Transcript_45136/g.59839 Transcript_45136/m.59839 type:complete len:205 (-) Transcript_45136:73-687(-)